MIVLNTKIYARILVFGVVDVCALVVGLVLATFLRHNQDRNFVVENYDYNKKFNCNAES